ncbi:MAG TPA: hypothetical protein VGB18_05060, partial [Candidatus Thermoplasmatota archaeon]
MNPMRILSVLVILALLLAALPTSGAQTTPGTAYTVRAVDPDGDVHIRGPFRDQPDTGGEYPHADILEVWVGNETVENIEFGLRLKEVPESATNEIPFTSSIGYSWQFRIGTANYTIGQGPDIESCAGGFGVQKRWGQSSSTSCGGSGATVNPETKTLQFAISRQRLTNESEYPFGPGLEIAELRADTAMAAEPIPNLLLVDPRSQARDRAPDEGFLETYRSSLSNSTGAGGLELIALEPLRISNGESTTLVYPLTINNIENRETTALLTIENTEKNFDVRVPSRLTVPATESIRFPVILSMGFEHRHGQIGSFKVRAEDAIDPGRWSEVTLGVYWLDTPQPAGHHDRLWLHSGGGAGSFGSSNSIPYSCDTIAVWMNPLAKETGEGVTDAPVPGCSRLIQARSFPPVPETPDEFRIQWFVPLQPELAIGLDFDLARTGQFNVAINPGAPAGIGALHMDLLHRNPAQPDPDFYKPGDCPGTWIKLASQFAQFRALTYGTPAPFDFDFELLQGADYLPYQKHADLALLLTLVTDRPQHPPNYASEDVRTASLIVEGAELVLPLVEYHDPIDQLFQNVGTLSLTPLSPFEKLVNPGRKTLFHFQLASTAPEDQTVQVSLEGPNQEWAVFHQSQEQRLRPGEKRNLTLAIEAPVDASDTERAELFLIAENLADPNVVAVSRLRATVVDQAKQDIPDEQG